MPPTPVKDQEILVPDLHSGQKLVKAERKKRNFVCAHRGWRKSSLAIHLVVEHLLTGQNAGWYAPTFNVVTSSNWVDFKKVAGGDSTWFNKNESSWTIPGRGTCFFFSMDRPESARGGTFSLAIGEEMGEWSDGIFESIVEPIVQKADGEFWGIGTPNIITPLNDFHRLVELAASYPDTHNSYIIPAWGADFDANGDLVEGLDPSYRYCCKESPFRTFKEMAASWTRARNPDRWQIEYLCRFISSEGVQFSGVDEACILKPILERAA